MACAADLTQPTVMTCLAHTNCGDRINNNFHGSYNSGTYLLLYKINVRNLFVPLVVGTRFANIAKNGELMTEKLYEIPPPLVSPLRFS